MSDKSLLDRLASLAAEDPEFDGKARVLDASDPLAAILDEIDTTLLPAVLRFDTGTAQLTLHAGGRMLNQVMEYAGPRPAPDNLLGVGLDAEDEAQLAAVAGVLCEFVRDCKRLTCFALVENDAEDTSTNRVSVTALQHAIDAFEAVEDQPPIERFLEACEAHIKAYLLADNGAEQATHGDTVTVGMLRVALKTQLAPFATGRGALAGGTPDNALNVFAGVLDPNDSLCVANFAELTLIFSIASKVTFDVIAAFERANG